VTLEKRVEEPHRISWGKVAGKAGSGAECSSDGPGTRRDEYDRARLKALSTSRVSSEFGYEDADGRRNRVR